MADQDYPERDALEAEVKRLRASEDRLRAAMDAGRIAVWEFDSATGDIRTDPGLNRLLGFPDDVQLNLEEVAQCYLPGERERLREAGRLAVEGGDPSLTHDYRFRRPDNGEVRWLQMRADINYKDDRTISGVIGIVSDITERREAELALEAALADRELLSAELGHRIKNVLTLVTALAKQSFRSAATKEQAEESLLARIAVLAQAQTALASGNAVSGSIPHVVRSALEPHGLSERFDIEGPELTLAARQAMSLALALHELATNAIKYGALSAPDGRVQVAWRLAEAEGGPHLHLHWQESGGPPAAEPARRGFGTRLIERALAADFSGEVTLDYSPAGLVCRLTAPYPTATA